jgi:hypothetical protein
MHSYLSSLTGLVLWKNTTPALKRWAILTEKCSTAGRRITATKGDRYPWLRLPAASESHQQACDISREIPEAQSIDTVSFVPSNDQA